MVLYEEFVVAGYDNLSEIVFSDDSVVRFSVLPQLICAEEILAREVLLGSLPEQVSDLCLHILYYLWSEIISLLKLVGVPQIIEPLLSQTVQVKDLRIGAITYGGVGNTMESVPNTINLIS